MVVIVTDAGFSGEDLGNGFTAENTLDLSSDMDPANLSQDILKVAAIRIDFPHFTDGRGFGIARALRDLGYSGRLTAVGKILPDQYTMVRRVGFDQVEITDDHAILYPVEQWLLRANWAMHSYQQRLQA